MHCFHRIYGCKKKFTRLYQFFSPNGSRNNDKIIYKCFKYKYGKTKQNPWFQTKTIDKEEIICEKN